MLWKCCTQCQQIWKTQQWPQGWKRSVFIPIPKKDSAKECSNFCTIALISHASKVMLKILQARLQQYVNSELPDHRKSKRVPEKHLLLLYWLCQILWLCRSKQTGKFLKMMLWKCCTQYISKFGKLSSGQRPGKGQFSFQSQRKAMAKNAQTIA